MCVDVCLELSLYELHRKPHEMVSDRSAIAVSPRALHSELMCPICLDLMTNTMTTKDVSEERREEGGVVNVVCMCLSVHCVVCV